MIELGHALAARAAVLRPQRLHKHRDIKQNETSGELVRFGGIDAARSGSRWHRPSTKSHRQNPTLDAEPALVCVCQRRRHGDVVELQLDFAIFRLVFPSNVSTSRGHRGSDLLDTL